MRTSILLAILFLCHSCLRSQDLVANGSFEDANNCEMQIPCCPAGWYSVSKWPYGYQNELKQPADGKHSLAFLIAFEKTSRTYWQTQLLCTLLPGETYRIHFYLYSPHKDMNLANFGIQLGNRFYRTEHDTLLQFDDHLSLTQAEIKPLKKPKDWLEVTLLYRATGNEKYCLLGNFNAKSNALLMQEKQTHFKYIEYYIDEFSITPVNKRLAPCAGYTVTRDSLYHFRMRHRFFNAPLPEARKPETAIPDTPVIQVDTLTLGDVFFNTDSDSILDTHTLSQYFDAIDLSTIEAITITGYTDSTGTIAYNQVLSLKRAQAVQQFLETQYELGQVPLQASGAGISGTYKELSQNRRVEIVVKREKMQ